MNSYPLLQMMRISVEFIAPLLNNAPVDPTDVSLTLTPPDEAAPIVVSFVNGSGVVKDSVGNYHYDFVAPTIGQYIYRWQGTGAAIASSGNSFFQVV
jgi:hypothetical protein